ncbi:MAG: flavin-containing monooxygenase [Solirubrobacteraceae bacterium]
MTPELLDRPVATDHVDVLIVGAGISGIGAAWHLQDKQPHKTYAVLEAREAIGGTWDLFRYPGIRSDSDLHTFGYAFKPWTGDKAIADGDAIRAYIRETAEDAGIDRHIRFGHRVLRAAFDTATARWTVEVEQVATGETVVMTANWLFGASGYYRYDEGFTPEFEGTQRFAGRIVHPQQWPEDLDYAGKRVVVIGSGATAVTLIPAMAGEAEHVTMLQRSPSYVLPLPSRDPIADALRKVLSEERAYAITRRKNILRQRGVYAFCRRFPSAARRLIRWVNEKQLPDSCDVDVHFKPKYDPWDQRLCAVPDADLYKALRRGNASVVTDHIETFTEHGILLRSGQELEADIVVTATGLNLLAFGGMELSVDGEAVSLPDTVAYKGLMLSGVPNFAYAIGYTNSSWTLKVDLVCEFFCRLLGHLDARGLDACVPEPGDAEMPTRPLLDFQAGYVLRALDRFPRQGEVEPWHLAMSYAKDVKYLREGAIDDGTLRCFAHTASTADTARDQLAAA